MDRSVLLACWPWLVILVASAVVLRLLCRMSQARLDLARLLHVHRNQDGSVQSLSFVITLPFFIMVLMTIVQVSQLMIGTMVVEYAAYAAARCAIVVIPARVSMVEPENCISSWAPNPSESTGVASYTSGPTEGETAYVVSPSPSSLKFQKIQMAAALACVPICPSAGSGGSADSSTLSTLISVYTSAASQSVASSNAISQRLSNKLSYAMNNTAVEVYFYHPNKGSGTYDNDLPLGETAGVVWPIYPYPSEYFPNEIGWQDAIKVKVTHNMALLPGPYATLIQTLGFAGNKVQANASGYSYTLTAEATMGNEGQKSVIPYEFYIY